MSRMSRQMRPELSEVDAMVAALIDAARPALSEVKLAAFEIAMAEALTNAVRYGVAAGAEATDLAALPPIEVTLSHQPRGVVVEIIDAGDQGPDDLYADVVAPEAIDLMAESGRGLSLIRHCTDDLSFEPAAGHNRLVLIFTPDVSA